MSISIPLGHHISHTYQHIPISTENNRTENGDDDDDNDEENPPYKLK